MNGDGLAPLSCPRCGRMLGEWERRHFVSDHHGRRVEYRGSGVVRVLCTGRLPNGAACGHLTAIRLDTGAAVVLA